MQVGLMNRVVFDADGCPVSFILFFQRSVIPCAPSIHYPKRRRRFESLLFRSHRGLALAAPAHLPSYTLRLGCKLRILPIFSFQLSAIRLFSLSPSSHASPRDDETLPNQKLRTLTISDRLRREAAALAVAGPRFFHMSLSFL